MMITNARGLYVHIPFCVRKCNYCDFCSFNLSSVNWRENYIDRLCEEIESYKGQDIAIDSIFFGGGTPSLLTADEFSRIVREIRSAFSVLPYAEFTVETNPKTLDAEKLETFLKCGVNRLSIGLQSIHENELKMLGRIHTYDDFLDSYRLARRFGMDNINIDLMYGIPEQSLASFEATLKEVISLAPEHISLYGLILEEGTPFYEKQTELALPREAEECDMYYLASRLLRAYGYNHYEISNYAKDGMSCRHNLKYWRGEEYIGVGLSAYSYFKEERFGNTDDYNEYLNDSCARYKGKELIDKKAEAYEYVMLRLRLSEGFSLEDYKSRFGSDFLDGRRETIERLQASGYVVIKDDVISLSERGFYVSNAILNELI